MAETGEIGNKEESSSVRCSEQDTLSPKSATERNGRTHTYGSVREKSQRVMKSFRSNFGLQSNKESKDQRAEADFGGSIEKLHPDMTAQRAPTSPSSSVGSPVTSPLGVIGGFFLKKEGDSTDGSPLAKRTLVRSSSDISSMTSPTGDSFKRASFFRRSTSIIKKDKVAKQAVPEIPTKEIEEEKEQETERLEIPEVYTLPDIPDSPLSVMQINELIGSELLEDAHLNLLSLRRQHEKMVTGEDVVGEDGSAGERANEQKDLRILYGMLRGKMREIVRDANHLHPDLSPRHNTELLVQVARIIQEEERREGEAGAGCDLAGPGDWRGVWREAVNDGVKAKLQSVPLEKKELNTSWLAVHLGSLGKTIVEDLENVKRDLRWCYPPSFKVFSTYVSCYHDAVGQHLKALLQKEADLKDNYALLNWIINVYESESIMGCPSLRPEMEPESTALCLEQGFLDQLKDKYCRQVREGIKASLDRLVELEKEEMWKVCKEPEKDPDGEFLDSNIHMDIWTFIKGVAVNSSNVEANLERKVVHVCLEELKLFPKRFEAEFMRCCSNSMDDDLALWAAYQITYINSFIHLKDHMENYREICPTEVTALGEELDGIVLRLGQSLGEQYKKDVATPLRRMMSRKWLTIDEDFHQLYSRTEELSQQCKLMRPPYVKTLVSDLHFFVVKNYISQLMKNDYSCKNRKHEKASRKMRDQWTKLKEIFEDMNTTNEWLHPIGDQLSTMIGVRNDKDIKNQLQPLVENYPDISKKHVAAVLYFRGVRRGRERHAILQRLAELKRKTGNAPDKTRALFSYMQVTVNNDCLIDLPFSCLSVCQPER